MPLNNQTEYFFASCVYWLTVASHLLYYLIFSLILQRLFCRSILVGLSISRHFISWLKDIKYLLKSDIFCSRLLFSVHFSLSLHLVYIKTAFHVLYHQGVNCYNFIFAFNSILNIALIFLENSILFFFSFFPRYCMTVTICLINS